LPEPNCDTENSIHTVHTIEQQNALLPTIEEAWILSTLISFTSDQMLSIPEIPFWSLRCDENKYLHSSSKLLICTKNLFAFWFYDIHEIFHKSSKWFNNYLHKDFIQYVPLCYSLHSQSLAENRNN